MAKDYGLKFWHNVKFQGYVIILRCSANVKGGGSLRRNFQQKD